MTKFLAATSALALLAGAPAFAQDNPDLPRALTTNALDRNAGNARAAARDAAAADAAQSAEAALPEPTLVANNADIGPPPAAYPVCRTHGQDRCRVASQAPAYALGETPPAVPGA